MDEQLIINGANAITMFCRQNIHAKKDLPLRASEIGLLIYTVKNDIPVTSIMAADFFKVSKPMIATMVKSLIVKGYLNKTISKVDKRSFTLTPTTKTIDLVEEVYEEYFKVVTKLLNGMGKEKFEDMIILLEEANNLLLKGEN